MFDGVMAQGVRASAYLAGACLVLAAGFVALRASAAVPAATCAVEAGEKATIAEVLSGGAVRLSDGRKVLLSGIEAPRASDSTKAVPFSNEAKLALARMLQTRVVTLGAAGAPSKTGWTRAQVFTGSGEWVQGALISAGFARVRTFPDRRDCAGLLLAREAAARSAKKGLWGHPEYAVRAADSAGQSMGKYGVFEGVVANTANVDGRVYLNFGEDFRTDFTIHVKPDVVTVFADSGVNLNALEGKRVRARGYVRERNGPMIDATVPEQVELIR